MENKINVAELLKDCTQGMELDCTMFEGVEFDCIVNDDYLPIRCRKKDPKGGYNVYNFTKYGCWNNVDSAKCVIFPKGKTTWEGFQRLFKDGDVVATMDGSWIGITKGGKSNDFMPVYCAIKRSGKFEAYFDKEKRWSFERLATEDEKEKLFNVIKENGYHWDNETKTLVKLKENVDDKVVMSGIYFDREYYADEVELHLNNYEIENRDGKTYAVFKNQETKISKPKFNDGDVIVDKYGAVAIYKRVHSSYEEPYVDFHCGITSISRSFFLKDSDSLQHCGEVDSIRLANEEEKQELFQAIKANGYKWNSETKTLENLLKFKVGNRIKPIGSDCSDLCYRCYIIKNIEFDRYILNNGQFLRFTDEHDFELVPNKFDISTLIPFESRVLVRNADGELWKPAIYGFSHSSGYYVVGGAYWVQCIPYEANKELLRTTNNPEEYGNK